MKKLRILALSGSLRKKSYNTALLHAASRLTPAGMEIIIFDEMKNLPLFNPDREGENITAVNKLLKEIEISDGLIISSPEYAHGISGVLKNALDWLVSSESFPYMPVALFNTSPRATQAQLALREVISTMSGNIIYKASTSFPLLGTNLDAEGIVKNDEISKDIIHCITYFRDKIHDINSKISNE